MKHIFTLILFFVFCFIAASAQNGCEQNLKQAEEFYTSGDYDNCVQLLENTIKECNLSAKKKEIALELLAKTYIEQDNLILAEKTVFSLLKNNPQYELKENGEHEDFEILVKKFDVHPLFSIGVRNAAMHPGLKSTKTYSVLNDVDYTAAYKTSKTVGLYYIIAEYEFKKNYSINIDIINFNINYNRGLVKNSDWKMNFREELSFIEIPLYFKKYFSMGKNFSTYAALGAGYLRMLKANGAADISYSVPSLYTEHRSDFTSIAETDMLSQRNRNSYECIAGLGVGYRFKNIAIYIDARYTAGINSLTNSTKRYQNSTLINDYFYVDNSVRLNKYEIGLSLAYTFKNVIKKVR
jgi:hypothetical protein